MSRGSKSTIDVLPGFVFRDRKEPNRARRCAPRASRSLPPPGMPDGCRCSIRRGSVCRLAVLLELDPAPSRSGRALQRPPTGTFQHSRRRARKASSSFCDKVTARPVAVPSEGALFSACRRSRPCAADRACRAGRQCRLASNFGWGFAGSTFFGGVPPSAFCCVFGSGFLAVFLDPPRRSDQSSVPAPWQKPASARALVAARGPAALVRPSSARAPVSAAAPDRTSQRSPACSRPPWRSAPPTGFASATFSTSGFGVSAFGAVRMPCVICEKLGRRDDVGRDELRRRRRSAACSRR